MLRLFAASIKIQNRVIDRIYIQIPTLHDCSDLRPVGIQCRAQCILSFVDLLGVVPVDHVGSAYRRRAGVVAPYADHAPKASPCVSTDENAVGRPLWQCIPGRMPLAFRNKSCFYKIVTGSYRARMRFFRKKSTTRLVTISWRS